MGKLTNEASFFLSVSKCVFSPALFPFCYIKNKMVSRDSDEFKAELRTKRAAVL